MSQRCPSIINVREDRYSMRTQEEQLGRTFLALAVTLIFTHSSLIAEQRDHSDKLIEAHGYRVQAERELSANCSLQKAEDWVKRSLETARSYRTPDQMMREDAGVFISGAEILLVQIHERQQSTNQTFQKVQALVARARLQSAIALLRQKNPPTCDPRLERITSEIENADTIARKTIADADAIVERSPKRAITLYYDAARSDSEFPGLAAKIQNAREMEARNKVGRSSGMAKAMGWIVLVAGLGAIGYAASNARKK
jgi:hypothetical protein